jgi:beta-glucosidase
MIQILVSLFCAWAVIISTFRQHVASAIDVDDLLSQMTVEEKVGQMMQIDIATFVADKETGTIDFNLMQSWISKYGIGSMLNTIYSGGAVAGKVGWTPEEWRQFIFTMQTFTQNSTRLKIPILYGIDSIHGASYIYGSTLFPHAIGVAASFNKDWGYSTGQIAAKDTRAAGIPWLFAPVLGLALQPLWSRFEETFGEDPYLASVMAASVIKGMQAPVDDQGIPSVAAACMKHFIAYSDPVDGHDRSPVLLADRVMQQLYRPAFQAAIDAGVLTAMESYNEEGGVPMASSSQYLKRLLRSPIEMNFTGMMVTDYREIENLNDWHHVAASVKEAVQLAMDDTSIDMSMIPLDASFYDDLVALVASGAVPISRIDESVRRILVLKDKLGLFNDPVPPLDDPLLKTVGSDGDWELSLNVSRDTLTLLKNSGGALPLNAKQDHVLVTGPTAASIVAQAASWTFHWQGASSDSEFQRGITILDAVKQAFTNVEYVPGPAMNSSSYTLDEATISTLANIDAVVVCVGEGTYAEKPGDIDDLALPAGQSEYVQALRANSPDLKIITIIVSGRPRLLNGIVEASSAVIHAYRPGPLGGQAVAEALTGQLVPSGRLPFTYPKNSGDVSYHYHHKTNDQCTFTSSTGRYYAPCEVEWAFGTGLSYTEFQYSQYSVYPTAINENSQVAISVSITNVGTTYRAGHVATLFLFDLYRRVTPEYKLLKR